MWYFSWILGLALACCLAIMTGIWYELRQTDRKEQNKLD